MVTGARAEGKWASICDLLSGNSGSWHTTPCLAPRAILTQGACHHLSAPFTGGRLKLVFSLFPYFILGTVFSLSCLHSLWCSFGSQKLSWRITWSLWNSSERSPQLLFIHDNVWKCVGNEDTEGRNADLQGSRGIEKMSPWLETGRG